MLGYFITNERELMQALVLLVFFFSAVQNTTRRSAALLFSISHLAYSFFMSHLNGHYYFMLGAYWDLVIMAGLSSLDSASKLIIGLQRASLCSIILNTAAWTAWHRWVDLTPYVMCYALLYIWVIYILIKNEPLKYGNRELGRGANLFRMPVFKGNFHLIGD